MTEAEAIARADRPRTPSSLVADLRALGLEPGDVVLCHASLSAIGFVAGGAPTVIRALLDVIGPTGTLAMPAHSGDYSDPRHWQNPPVPADWVDVLRAETPAFDPLTSPTRQMGRIAELFRSWPGAKRSDHPVLSFAALGPFAAAVTAGQPLTDPLGIDGPLGTLYRHDARVLLLGVGYQSCTALHLAERLAAPSAPREATGSPMLVAGERRWVSYDMPVLRDSDDDFPALGARFDAEGLTRQGPVGSAACRLVPMRALLDFAVRYWQKH